MEEVNSENPKPGTKFKDKEFIEVSGPISGLGFRAGKRVDGVYRYLANGDTLFNGGDVCGTSPNENPRLAYQLKSDEYFKKATICYCKKPIGAARVTRLCGAKFITNQNNFLSVNMGDGGQYNYSGSDCKVFEKEGKFIVGVHGMYKEGEEMTYLAPYFASEDIIKEKFQKASELESAAGTQGKTPAASSSQTQQSPQTTCTDVAPSGPYSCEQQASWGKCDEAWMQGKCDKSCNRCQ